MFRQYVQQGGRLLATHDTGLYDVNGNRLSEFTLGDVFGIRYKAQAEFSNDYYRLPKGPVSADMRPEWDVLVTGTANIVDSAGARPLGELRVPYYDGPPFHPVNLGEHNPPWKVVAPAIFLNRYGAGQTAYVPLGVDSAYVGEYPLPEHRLLIRNLVRYLSPNPRVRVDAPLSVEAVVTEDQAGSRYIIHFIGYQGPRVSVGVFSPRPRPFVVEEPLLYRAEIHLTAPPRAARGLSHKTQISQTGNSIRLTIEDVHESIIVSY